MTIASAAVSAERNIEMQSNNHFSIYTLPLFNDFNNELIHGISTRYGGVSEGCYRSLNLGLHVNDKPASVIENRKLFCSHLGLILTDTVCCEQVHGTNVHIVTQADKGKGACSLSDTIKDTDGLITNIKDIPLMLFFADCAPLLFYDPVNKAIGLSHAGWRGTAGDIAGKTLQAMQAAYGTDPEDCIAGIGPCIGQCCYEIGDETAEKFIDLFNKIEYTPHAVSRILCQKHGRYYLSLYEANKILLIEHGIAPQNISPEKQCTSCNSSVFYSYRADKGKTGRHAAIICLK